MLVGHYIGEAELPKTFYYTDQVGSVDLHAAQVNSCLIGDLSRVRDGALLAFGADLIGCGGAQWSLGFGQQAGADSGCFRPGRIPDELEREHFEESPALVRRKLRTALLNIEFTKARSTFPCQSRLLTFVSCQSGSQVSIRKKAGESVNR